MAVFTKIFPLNWKKQMTAMQKHSNMIIINVCPDCVQLYNPSSLGPIWVYMLSSSYISKMWEEEQWGPWHATREVGYCKIRESTFLDSVDRVVVRVGPRHGGQFPEHGVTTWDWDWDMVNLTRTVPSPVGGRSRISHLLVRQPVLPHVDHEQGAHGHRPVELCVLLYK